MFCPKCELQIKGDDQIKCPICDSDLVENPLDSPQSTADDDNFIIDDLADKDVDDSLDQDLSVDSSLDFQDDDISVDDLKPDMEEEIEPVNFDNPEKDIFKLDEKPASSIQEEQPEELKLDESTETDESSDSEKDIFKLEEEHPSSIKEELPEGLKLDESTETDESSDSEKDIFKLEEESTVEPVDIDEEEVFELDLPQDDGALEESQEEPEFKIDEVPEISNDEEDTVDPDIKDSEPLSETDEDKQEFEPEMVTDFDKSDDEDAEIPDDEFSEPDIEETTTLDDIDPLSELAHEEPRKTGAGRRILLIVLIFIIGAGIGFGALYYFKDKEEPPPVVVEKPAIVKPEKPPKPEPAVAEPVEDITVKEEIVKPEPEEKTVEEETPPEVVKKPDPVIEEKPEPTIPKVTYSVHAGSYRNSERANAEVRRFSNQGFNAYIERTDLREKGIWYRVKIGMFATEEEAKQEQDALNKKIKGIESRVVRN